MANKCKLCGGRLAGGICMECGMNNGKSDQQYQSRLNRTSCDTEDLTHVHEAGNVEEYEAPTLNRNRTPMEAYPKRAERPNIPRAESGKFSQVQRARVQAGKNRSAALLVIVVLAVVLVVVSVMGYKNNKTSESVSVDSSSNDAGYEPYEFDTEEYVQYEYDPYEYVEKVIPESGETFETDLEAGFYVVGYDIPEGTYTMEAGEGMNVEVTDKDSRLWLTQRFGNENYEVLKKEEVELFQNGIVMVDGGNKLHITTKNAQTSAMVSKAANPVSEEYSLEGTAEVGKDFPPGIYDVKAEEGTFGLLEITILPSLENDYERIFSFMMDSEKKTNYPDYTQVLKNIVLPEGAKLNSDDLKLIFTPSASVVSEDYTGFYKNMN